MASTEDALLWVSLFLIVLFFFMTTLWMLYSCGSYLRGVYHFKRHQARKTRKKKVRKEEEAYRDWKRKNEIDWINYQFQVQTGIFNSRKLPGDFEPDCPTPPCEAAPGIGDLKAGDDNWEDNAKWAEPPNFFKYWCSRREKFLLEKEEFDSQHVHLNKNSDEYAGWKRKHEEELQRAIKNHPIAATFLQMGKVQSVPQIN